MQADKSGNQDIVFKAYKLDLDLEADKNKLEDMLEDGATVALTLDPEDFAYGNPDHIQVQNP